MTPFRFPMSPLSVNCATFQMLEFYFSGATASQSELLPLWNFYAGCRLLSSGTFTQRERVCQILHYNRLWWRMTSNSGESRLSFFKGIMLADLLSHGTTHAKHPSTRLLFCWRSVKQRKLWWWCILLDWGSCRWAGFQCIPRSCKQWICWPSWGIGFCLFLIWHR